MSVTALAYPFLLIAIFFESFVLVTFLSKPARLARGRGPALFDDAALPSVAIIVPCWNEEKTIAATLESLLALKYPKDKLEIIAVDNASSDGTPQTLARFAADPRVKALYEGKRGKHNAVNAGIAATSATFIGCLDADSFVDPDALLEIIPSFTDERVAATTAAMSVEKPDNLIRHMQNAEYIFGITLRQALSSVNGLYVTPGPFSLYRRDVVVALGGFRYAHQTEDMEMALRLQKAGYRIENAPRARVYTRAPRTVYALVKQRTRWTSGFMRNIAGEYRSLVGNRKHGALGLIVLPVGLIAIVSGMLLFILALWRISEAAVSAFEIRSGVPLSYALSLHGHLFDWFYLPSSLYVLLGATTVLASLALIVIGKRMSRTPGSLSLGLISYVLLYGVIAPLWLIRATTDVALGKHRGWR